MRSSKRNIIILSLAILASGIAYKQFLSQRKIQNKNGESHSFLFQNPPELQTEEKNRALKMTEAAKNWIKSHFIPGSFAGGYLISWKGHTLLEGYQGETGKNNHEKINEQTPIHIASISKTFTAMAILKLMDEKKVDIHAPVSTYLPSFNFPGITVKLLLNHRSGLPKYEYFMEKLGWPKNIFASNLDVLKLLTERRNEIDDIQKPDTHFKYCNTNFVLLALIIEKVSGKPYPVFMQEEIFTPMGMTNSFVYSDKDSVKITSSFEWSGNKFVFNHLDKIYGDKNIFSTPRDLLKWDEGLKRSNFLNPASLSMAYTPYSNEKSGSRNYGLGWRMIINPEGEKLIYHNGWWHGNNTVFLRLLSQDATIIVLGNQYNRGIYKAKEMLSIFDPRFNPEKTDD